MTVAVAILALETTIMPLFIAQAMLLIVLPLAFVDCFVGTNKFALTLAHMVLPLADIEAAVRVEHASLAAELVMDPITVVTHTIRPNLTAPAVTFLYVPLAQIERVILNFLLCPIDAL